MAVNTSKMWSKGIEIAFFSESVQISPSGWGICPQTPIATGDWRLRPQTPVCDTFGYTSFLNTSPKVDILHFLIISFRPFPLPKSWLRANRLRLQIFHSTISLPSQKVPFFENFWWRHCMWFVVWGPPQSKILITPMALLHTFEFGYKAPHRCRTANTKRFWLASRSRCSF